MSRDSNWAVWRRFWFEPADVTPLAVFRIAIGLLAVVWTIALLPNLHAFFTSGGVIQGTPHFPLDVFAVSSSTGFVFAMWFALLIAALCLMTGFGTRIAAVLAWLLVLSFERRNPLVFNSGDVVLRVELFLLMLTPSGAALSIDRWLRHRSAFWDFPKRAPWGLRLLQLQVSAIYLFTVWDKMQGHLWNNGTAVSYAFQMSDLARVPAPGWLVHSLLLVNLMTYGTLVLEVALAFLVWNRRLRPWVLLCGVCLHLSIDLTMTVGLFSFFMISSYLTFVPPQTMTSVVERTRQRLTAFRARRLASDEAIAPEPIGVHVAASSAVHSP